jgi:hypothetical protein
MKHRRPTKHVIDGHGQPVTREARVEGSVRVRPGVF